MSERMTEAEAIATLQEGVEADGGDRSDLREFRETREEVANERAEASQEQVDDSGATASAEGTTEQDSFTGLDPNSLPPELVPFYRSMQADYTRGKQEIAELNRQYEALEQYGGVDNAVQALDWIDSLRNPDNVIALYNDLRDNLIEQGYSVEQAEQAAERGVAQAQEDELDEFGSDEPDNRFESLKQELEDLKQDMAEREEREYQQYLEAELDRQEATVIRDHPEWGDEDMEHVYNLAYATGANLEKAAELYTNMQTHILGGYLDKKASAPDVQELPASPAADQSERITDLNDARIDKMVNRFLAEEMASQE